MYGFSFFIFLIGATIAHPYQSVNSIEDDYSQDPDREVIPVIHGYHKNKNDHRVLQLTSFQKTITLYLKPTDGYFVGHRTPVFVAKADSDQEFGVRYKMIPNAIRLYSKIFHDKRYLAALTIAHDENAKPLIYGTIGDVYIQPIPLKSRKKFIRQYKRSAENRTVTCDGCFEYDEIDFTHDHIVTRIVPKNDQPFSITREAQESEVEQKTNVFNEVPEVIYPELLITVESSLFDIFYQDIDATIQYVLSYWNAVDLRYRSFLNPNIRLNIAAIILARDAEATPYLAKNYVGMKSSVKKRKVLSMKGALADGPLYFYNETLYNDRDIYLWMEQLKLEYDVAITMTANDLCELEPECVSSGEYICEDRDVVNCSPLGTAFYTGACAYDPEEKKMEAFAVLEDVGNFDSIIPSAHELGHLFGASHSEKNKHKCPTWDGHIMSYSLTISEKVFQWSNCSIYSINSFLKEEERAQCLFNKPRIGIKLPNILPGDMFTRDELCHRITKTKSCDEKKYNEDCVQLYCTSEYGNCYGVPDTAVPEGTSCGINKRCINAQCLGKDDDVTVQMQVGTSVY